MSFQCASGPAAERQPSAKNAKSEKSKKVLGSRCHTILYRFTPLFVSATAAARTHAPLNLVSWANKFTEKGRARPITNYVIKRQPLDNDKIGIVAQCQSEEYTKPVEQWTLTITMFLH